MPEWVYNRVILQNGKSAKDVFKDFLRTEQGETKFDFNKLIQRPSDLNISDNSYATKAIAIYNYRVKDDSSLLKKIKQKSIKWNMKNIPDDIPDIANYYEAKYKKSFKNDKSNDMSIEEYGRRLCENLENYGYMTWFDWSADKWGTQWNAKNTNVNGNVLTFNTAWNTPHPIFEKLCSLLPDEKFLVLWESNEAWGSYANKNGVLVPLKSGTYEK